MCESAVSKWLSGWPPEGVERANGASVVLKVVFWGCLFGCRKSGQCARVLSPSGFQGGLLMGVERANGASVVPKVVFFFGGGSFLSQKVHHVREGCLQVVRRTVEDR